MIKELTAITPEYLKYRLEEQEEYYNQEIERLHSIIKEVREYIERNKQYAELEDYGKNGEYYIDEIGILEILDKENI